MERRTAMTAEQACNGLCPAAAAAAIADVMILAEQNNSVHMKGTPNA